MSPIAHHPDENLLAEFCAGSLDWGLALAVSAHIYQCPQCARQAQELNQLGGCLLGQTESVAVGSGALDKTLQKIRSRKSTPVPMPVPDRAATTDRELKNLPPVVLKALGPKPAVRWRFVTPTLKTARIPLAQSRCEVAFHKISSGGKVAEHGHRGQEITLVLKGSFSDEKGVYQPGDFLVRNPGDVHRPTATQNQDCLCLSVLAAPVALTGLFGKLLNPFLSFRPG